jgi:hypothetical protein
MTAPSTFSEVSSGFTWDGEGAEDCGSEFFIVAVYGVGNKRSGDFRSRVEGCALDTGRDTGVLRLR